MHVNSKNTQTNFILFTIPRQYKYKNTFRKDICQPLDGGFLWGKREGNGTGQGNKRDHNFLSDVNFLKKKRDPKKLLKSIFPIKESTEGKGKMQATRFRMSGTRIRQCVA